jgi:hypothetical protein
MFLMIQIIASLPNTSCAGIALMQCDMLLVKQTLLHLILPTKDHPDQVLHSYINQKFKQYFQWFDLFFQEFHWLVDFALLCHGVFIHSKWTTW